jgi:hypothetical protein
MSHKELATHLRKFHQVLEPYGQLGSISYEANGDMKASIALHAASARIETYLDYKDYPALSALNRLSRIDIEDYKKEAVKQFQKKLTQFMKVSHVSLRTEKLCAKLLSELKYLD